jgi:MFS family permease
MTLQTVSNAVGSEPAPRWYVGASRDQWRAFWSSYIGWALDIMDLLLFSILLSHISHDLDMSRSTAGAIASASLVATAFGGIVFGFVADRFGRARSMVMSIFCYSIGTVLCGFSQDVTQLLLFRIVVGLGVGGEWSAGAALITETWPARHRGKVMAWVQSAFATGYALAAVVAAVLLPFVGWRGVLFFGVAPAILAFWIRKSMPEPEIWRAQQTRLSPLATMRSLGAEHGRNTFICLAFTAAAMCGYWGLFTWIPTWLGSPASAGGPGLDLVKSTTWIVVMQVGAALGFISFGYVADRVGRKAAFLIYFLLSAACVPVYTLISTPSLLLAFGPIVAFFGTGFYSGFAPTFAELFPTSVRATAQGFIYNTGRAISALAPAGVGLLSARFGLGGALSFTAGFFVLAAVIVALFVPETKGEKLQ